MVQKGPKGAQISDKGWSFALKPKALFVLGAKIIFFCLKWSEMVQKVLEFYSDASESRIELRAFSNSDPIAPAQVALCCWCTYNDCSTILFGGNFQQREKQHGIPEIRYKDHFSRMKLVLVARVSITCLVRLPWVFNMQNVTEEEGV